MAHNRFYDPQFKCNHVNVLPGDFYISNKDDEMIVTVLGSCIAVCIRNLKTGYGGLNHFLLAEPGESVTSPSNRYGSYAMEQLINGLLVHGGVKSDFEIKVFGGSSLFQNTNPVGTNNINFIHKYLQNEGMKITSEDVGGNTARKIHYWPTTGKVSRLMINQNEGLFVLKEEESYKSKLAGQNTGGGIELF